MTYNLPYERDEISISGCMMPNLIAGKTIDDHILDTTRGWARRKHLEEHIPFSYHEKTPEIPEGIKLCKYNGRSYTPWEMYTFMEMAHSKIERYGRKFLEWSKRDRVQLDEVKAGDYFIREVHKTMREFLFDCFMPKNKRRAIDPTKKSVKSCLEYLSKHASTEIIATLDATLTPRYLAQDILKGGHDGMRSFRLITELALEEVYIRKNN